VIDDLAKFSLVYLATPYTKYRDGIDCAFRDSAALAAQLLKLGIKVYSPIAHCHPIALYGELNPLDHSVWIPFDEAMMTAADVLLVAQLDGWRESYGINHEIQFFKAAGKPVFYLDCLMMTAKPEPHGFRANSVISLPDSELYAAGGHVELEGSVSQSGSPSPDPNQTRNDSESLVKGSG
jgi:hypothetical protein